MILTGAIVNAAVIAVCAAAGTYLIRGIPERFQETCKKGVGLCVLFIGLQGALKNEDVMLLIISVVIGCILGEWWNIEKRMEDIGNAAEKKFGFGEGNFARGFAAASILFCTGSMAIVGSINSGLMLDHEMLYAKSILDGILSVVFASTMGIGVAFSSVPILIYEGGLAMGASFFRDFLTESMIREMSAVGSLIIAGIGFNFLGDRQIRVANMIPAIFVPCVYEVITPLIRQITGFIR